MDSIELRLTVSAVDDTTAEEVAAATRRLSEALADRAEVASVRPVVEPAPEGAKVGEAMALGALLLAVGPVDVKQVLGMVRDLFNRPGGTPTKVSVERSSGKVAVEFDPRHTSAEEITALARQLTADLDKA